MERNVYDEEVAELLRCCELPVDDLQSSSNIALFGLRHEGMLLGVVGVETCGDIGLLRSLLM